MAKSIPSQEVLEECWKQHLPYELNMLRETYSYLMLDHGTTINNALIESFCIHARNLIEFYRGSEKNDYLKAKYFTGGSYNAAFVAANTGLIGNKLYEKLNQQIAHMSRDRTADAAKKIGRRDREKIMAALEKEEAAFRSSVKAPWASTVQTGGSPPSSSSSITTASLSVSGKAPRG